MTDCCIYGIEIHQRISLNISPVRWSSAALPHSPCQSLHSMYFFTTPTIITITILNLCPVPFLHPSVCTQQPFWAKINMIWSVAACLSAAVYWSNCHTHRNKDSLYYVWFSLTMSAQYFSSSLSGRQCMCILNLSRNRTFTTLLRTSKDITCPWQKQTYDITIYDLL